MARIGGGLAAVARQSSVDAVPQRTMLADFLTLLKPRVMSLVVFTGAAGLAAAPGLADPAIGAAALLAMAVGAGGCGALNMWYDADIDAVMGRTQRRPIPSGRVSPAQALLVGCVLSAASVIALYVLVNGLAAGLLAFTIAFYIFVYTMGLKRRTPQNIVIGGLAGALPPVIGWAAATGSIDHRALSLCLIILLWTPPHFWALAIARATDYEKAGVPMMPVVAGNAATARQCLAYTILLCAASYLPAAFGMTGTLYALAVTGLNAMLLWRAIELWREARDGAPCSGAALRLFGYSILYLFALHVAILADAR